MAHSLEQVLEIQLGKMQLHIASLLSQMEALREECDRLTGRVKELEAMTPNPSPDDGKGPRRPRLVPKEASTNG